MQPSNHVMYMTMHAEMCTLVPHAVARVLQWNCLIINDGFKNGARMRRNCEWVKLMNIL